MIKPPAFIKAYRDGRKQFFDPRRQLKTAGRRIFNPIKLFRESSKIVDGARVKI
jgi:hypothetical protein